MDNFQVIIFILVILLGLAVGSLLNVIISRFDDLRSILTTRSHCPKCKKILPWYDLVPFLSYFLLAGKCRSCRGKISLQYPLVEATTALIYALIYWKFSLSIDGLFWAIISSILVCIAAYDILHLRIPDILSYLGMFFALGLIVWQLAAAGNLSNFQGYLFYLYGLIVGAGFFGVLVVVSRQKWMGAGDVLLGALMGLLIGFPDIILALALAFVLGAVVSIFLILAKQKTMKDVVPFGPFLVAATFLTIFWGQELIEFYLLKFSI